MWHKDMRDRPFKMAALSDMTVTRRDLVAERKEFERIKDALKVSREDTAKAFELFGDNPSDFAPNQLSTMTFKDFSDCLLKQISDSMAMLPSPDRIIMQNCRCVVKPLDESIKEG